LFSHAFDLILILFVTTLADSAPKLPSPFPPIHGGGDDSNGKLSPTCATAASRALLSPRSSSQGGAEATGGVAAAEVSTFPYPTDADDHCETPLEAFEHIVFFLQTMSRSFCGHASSSCSSSKRSSSTLRIYDPYYCDGAVKRNFSALGFPNVYNEKQDCYAIWKEASSPSSPLSSTTTTTDLPEFDVLVTNPPYSGDHVERLMEFVTSRRFGNRPWCLLLPNWVHKKDYYIRATSPRSSNKNHNNSKPRCQPFYLIPRKRYVYLPPKGFRQAKKSDVHKKASPFVSMWYICK
jgi:hypothetical protein